MARTHARILTEIWDDEDFLLCSGNAQRLYLMLLSQPELGHSGLLAITLRRWSGLAADTPTELLDHGISELCAARFILVDLKTEELLIRSMVRNDGVWKQPKVLAVALTEASRMRSRRLREAFVQELDRIDVALLPAKTKGDVEALLRDLPKTLAKARVDLHRETPPDPPNDPPPHPPAEPPVYDLSQAQADPPRGRGTGVQIGAEGVSPVPGSRADALPAPGADAPRHTQAALDGTESSPPSLTITQRSKRITDAYAEVEPMCKWPAVNGVVIKAIKAERWTDDVILAAVLRLAEAKRSVTVDALRFELDPPDNVRQFPDKRFAPGSGSQLPPRDSYTKEDYI
jgi:hypothetical protein